MMGNIKPFIFLLLICSSFSANAQDSASYKPSGTFIYGDIGGGYGTHGSFNMTMNVIDKHDNIFSLAYCFSSRRDNQRPGDYKPGLLDFYPQRTVSMYGLMYGKVFHLPNSVARFIVRGSITAGIATYPENYTASSGWFSSNYDYTTRREFCAGLMLNPMIELPVHSKSGFSFGLYGNINYVSPVFGLEGTMLFGKLRNKTPREIKRYERRKARRNSEN
jgi:hypothetical protein